MSQSDLSILMILSMMILSSFFIGLGTNWAVGVGMFFALAVFAHLRTMI